MISPLLSIFFLILYYNFSTDLKSMNKDENEAVSQAPPEPSGVTIGVTGGPKVEASSPPTVTQGVAGMY